MFVKTQIFSKLAHCLRIRPCRQTALCYAGDISHCRYRTASCFDQHSKSYCQWPVLVAV